MLINFVYILILFILLFVIYIAIKAINTGLEAKNSSKENDLIQKNENQDTSGQSVADELIKLENLLKSKSITQDEFEKAKKKIFND